MLMLSLKLLSFLDEHTVEMVVFMLECVYMTPFVGLSGFDSALPCTYCFQGLRGSTGGFAVG